MATRRIETLDIFRGLAISLVVLYHYTARLPATVMGASDPLPAVQFGWLGVYFFFILSGYCILLTLDRSRSVGQFLAKRFSRVYPAFVAATVLLFALGPVLALPSLPALNYREIEPTLVDAIGNLLMLGGLFQWVNGSFWSIVVEVKFYLLAALLAAIVTDRQGLVRILCWVGPVLAAAWIPAKLGADWLPYSNYVEFAMRYGLIAPYLPFFAIGAIGYQMHRGERGNGALLAANLVVTFGVIWAQVQFGRPEIDLPTFLSASAMFAALAGLFLWFAAGGELPRVPVASRLLARAGLVSYSWYLLHENIGIGLLIHINPVLPHWAALGIAILATYLAAELFSWLCEWRFRSFAQSAAMNVCRWLRLDRIDPLGGGQKLVPGGRVAGAGLSRELIARLTVIKGGADRSLAG